MIRQAERCDGAVSSVVAGTKVYEENLIFFVVDDGFEFFFKLGFFSRVQVAFEDGELEVVAPVAAGLEDAGESFVIANVVADEVGAAHGGWCLNG